MSAPDTIIGAIVLILVILPGLPGDRLYRGLAGISRHEKDRGYLLRLLSFSVLGLVVYSIIAARTGWPAPDYVVPATFTHREFNMFVIARLGIAYIGQVLAACVVAAAAAIGALLMNHTTMTTPQRDAWDEFVRTYAREHWVAVRLTTDEVYLGVIEHADISVDPEHRDLVLAEPYCLDEDRKIYMPTFNQFMFIRGVEIAGVVVLYHGQQDRHRRAPVATAPFTPA